MRAVALTSFFAYDGIIGSAAHYHSPQILTGEGNGLPISPLPSRAGWNICSPASDGPILAYRRLCIVLKKVIPLRELAHGFLSGHAKIPHEQYSLLQSGFLRLFGNIVVVDGLNFFLVKERDHNVRNLLFPCHQKWRQYVLADTLTQGFLNSLQRRTMLSTHLVGNLAETDILIDDAAASIIPQDLDGQLHVLHPAILRSTFIESGQQ